MIINANKISLTFDDTETMKKVGVSVPSAKDGKISTDGMERATDCTVQKEMGSSIVYTEAEARQLHMEDMEVSQDNLLSPADFISQCMTGEDAKDLSEEKTPLEEYTSSQLERAVSRVKEQRSEKEEAISDYVSKEKEEAETLQENTIKRVAGDLVSSVVLGKLEQSPLLVNTENVMRLSHAVQLTQERQNISPASVKFFIGNGFAITPENISNSVHGGKTEMVVEELAEESQFVQIEAQVQEILQEGGLTISEENMDTAKWLFANELPVTAENIRIFQRLEEIKAETDDTLIGRIVDNMLDGMLPEKSDLTKWSVKEAKVAIKKFTEADSLQAKRQLEEIRLTMTVEAARTMSSKGIELDVSNLEKIVEELKIQEQQARNALLQETGLPVTAENAEIMGDTLQAAKTVLAAPVEVLGVSFRKEVTLVSLAEEAVHITRDFAKAEQTYEAVGTQVRKDLGDSMTKAFQNVDAILEDLDLEVTAMNRRAVRILSYNQMVLQEENILQMKEHDSRVTTLMKDLKPQVVAELIRKEINPLELSLEELSQEVAAIADEIQVEDVSFRKFLWKMDHQDGITPEERQSMIGVYRLLDKIEKSDGAVIGQVVKEGKEMSLANLLSAVRTRKNAGMDVQVNDDFGELEDLQTKGVSISQQIEAAYSETLVTELKKNLSPKVLKEENWESSLEVLMEECQEENSIETVSYYEEVAESIRQTMANAEENIQSFLQKLDMPDNAKNLQMVQAMLENGGKALTSLWKEEESEELIEHFDEPESLEEFYEEVDKNHEKTLENQAESDDINYGGIVDIAKMANSISFYRQVRTYQMYEVPIMTESGWMACHVTFQNGETAEKGTVEISAYSDELGQIRATFKVSGKRVKGFMTTEKKESLEDCQKILKNFEMDLEENGFTMEGNLVQGSRSSLHVGDKAEGTKNRDLYQVAKWFLENLKGKEDSNEN